MKHSIFLRIFLGLCGHRPLPGRRRGRAGSRADEAALYHPGEATHLEHLAALLEGQVGASLDGRRRPGRLEDYVKDIGRKTSTRITVIRPDGTVLADSETEPAGMENHLYRPEIFAALQGEKQMAIRRARPSSGT